MSNEIIKQIDSVKKEIRDQRKECLNLESKIKKQMRKVDEHDRLFQEFISLTLDIEAKQKKVNQGEIIEKDQLDLISKLQKEITFLRQNFFNNCS